MSKLAAVVSTLKTWEGWQPNCVTELPAEIRLALDQSLALLADMAPAADTPDDHAARVESYILLLGPYNTDPDWQYRVEQVILGGGADIQQSIVDAIQYMCSGSFALFGHYWLIPILSRLLTSTVLPRAADGLALLSRLEDLRGVHSLTALAFLNRLRSNVNPDSAKYFSLAIIRRYPDWVTGAQMLHYLERPHTASDAMHIARVMVRALHSSSSFTRANATGEVARLNLQIARTILDTIAGQPMDADSLASREPLKIFRQRGRRQARGNS